MGSSMRTAAFTAMLLLIFASSCLTGVPVRAHCDGLDGPVVSTAREALESGNLKRALIWVRASDEAELRTAFKAASEDKDFHDRTVAAIGQPYSFVYEDEGEAILASLSQVPPAVVDTLKNLAESAK